MRADVVVVGGGVIGSCVALHLRERLPTARIVVVERDATYARSSSRLATGGIRQQYGSPLNVSMARHSVAFYAHLDARLADIGYPGRVRFRQRGYLFVADATNAERLERRLEEMHASGAKVERWSRARVASHVPGLVTDDVAFGVFGPADGYLEPREVLAGLRALAVHAGAEYVDGEVVSVGRAGGSVTGVVVSSGGGARELTTPVVVNAAGAFAAAVGRAAGLELPIAPVRQHLFRLELAAPLPSRIPMTFDPDGTHWRLDDRPGDAVERLVIGRSREDEPAGENFTCDDARLHDELLPTLARRYPAARVAGVAEAWAGLYEMTPDHNALLGAHPALRGFVCAAGFSGHGLMMAPATATAIAELVSSGASETFDISPLAPDRFERGVMFSDGALI